MLKKSSLVAVTVAVVAGLIVTAITEVFPFNGGSGSNADSSSVSGNGNSSITGNGNSITNNLNDQGGEPNPHVIPYGNETDVPFTVENSERHGIWELRAPDMRQWSSADEKPVEGANWLVEPERVKVRCALSGTPYPVTIHGVTTPWHFYAELEDGNYVPMGGLAEVTHDGGQHLVRCTSA